MTSEAAPLTEAEAIALGLDQPVPYARALRPAPTRIVPVEVNVLEIDQPSAQPVRTFVYDVERYVPWHARPVRIVLDTDRLSAVGYFLDDSGRPGDSFTPPMDLIAAAISAAGPEVEERARNQIGGRLISASF